MKRIGSIDSTRGLVMVIMALDHVRDFMHTTSMSQDPTNLQTTTTLLFMTRWITHLCAPTFVFLSGVSAFISLKRNNNYRESRSFLLKRGLWLVLLEFTFINFALWFDIHFRLMIMEVISAIGFGFIILSLILKLSPVIIGISGILIIFCHNLLQGISIPPESFLNFFTSILFRPSLMKVTPEFSFFTAYPLIPWLGIILAGFGCGTFFELPAEKRIKIFKRIGITALILFTIIRYINLYGDPVRWSEQKDALFTFLSFVNTTKYPPSLLFALLFLGIMFLVLYASEKVTNRLSEILMVYGRVPLFYFVIHLYIIHLLMFGMLFIQGFHGSDLLFGVFNNGRPKSGSGVELPIIYLIWSSVVLMMYPICKMYGRYKAENRDKQILRFL
jgi:uncharacterized membrane protein